jgi:hypothetical protein
MFMPVLASALLDPPFYRKRGFANVSTSSRVFPAGSDSSNPALGIVDHLRRRFARFKLGADLLDLRCLLF